VARGGSSFGISGAFVLLRPLTMLVLALLWLVAAAREASAAVREYASDTTVYADGQFRHLATVSVDATQGNKFLVQARMQAESADVRMLAAMRLLCEPDDRQLRTTQNMYAGQDLAIIRGRYIFEAPNTGTFDCHLHVKSQLPSGLTTRSTFKVEGSGTWISTTPQPSWAKHGYQNEERLITPYRSRYLLGMDFTAPAGVNSFHATGDVELTNCYNSYHICRTDPANGNRSMVGTRLLVMQQAVAGGYCRVTRWPSSGLDEINVSWAVHHKKNYHRLHGIQVDNDPGCTRNFRIKVYARHLAGNDMMVEVAPWSNVFVHAD
jgi:hypothetical protein